MIKRLRALLRALPQQRQRGFTLIEMLVVISILGILAAVVTMSMVGVTNLAQSRADDAEKRTIQVALDTMANEQQLDANAVCTSPFPDTNNMANFPVPAPSSMPTPGPGAQIPLYSRYLRTQTMHRFYTCDASGVVSFATPPAS